MLYLITELLFRETISWAISLYQILNSHKYTVEITEMMVEPLAKLFNT